MLTPKKAIRKSKKMPSKKRLSHAQKSFLKEMSEKDFDRLQRLRETETEEYHNKHRNGGK